MPSLEQAIRIVAACIVYGLVAGLFMLGRCSKVCAAESYSISVLDSNGANRNLVIVEVEQAGRTRSFLVHKDELEKPDTIEAIAQEVERGTH